MSRVRRVAVFAHFDSEGRVPVHTRRLLDELLDNVESIVLVSTHLEATEATTLDPRIKVIVRDNVGYDFYSFRTGVLSIEALYAYDELVIANDSVITVNSGGITRAFHEMADDDCDAWSMTESWQVDRHLQSYFLVFRKSAFFTKYFLDFWRSVRVLHDKWQIILTYEIGLTQWLVRHGARITSAFKPSMVQEAHVRARLREKMLRAGVASKDATPTAEDVKVANPVHFLWEALFQQYGFIKSEVLRDDPNGVVGVDLARLIVDGPTRAEVEAEIQRARRTRLPPVPLGTDGVAEPGEDVLVTHGVGAIDVSRLSSDVAIVLHLYHVDLLADLYEYMQNIVCVHDVFVSVRSVNDFLVARDFFAERKVNAFVYVHRNIGRDVGPFMTLFGTGILDRYVAVCKIHSKKSVYHAQGGAWRNDLLKALLGSSHQVLRIVQAFRDSKACGMIGPELAYVSDARFWGGNEARLRKLASEIGIAEEAVRLGFFAGTMFWVRPEALGALRARSLSLSDFDEERGQRDATLAHVIERILTLCVIHEGFYLSSTRTPGEPLMHERYAKQGVLVLPS